MKLESGLSWIGSYDDYKLIFQTSKEKLNNQFLNIFNEDEGEGKLRSVYSHFEEIFHWKANIYDFDLLYAAITKLWRKIFSEVQYDDKQII
jgi:hypothetical protein